MVVVSRQTIRSIETGQFNPTARLASDWSCMQDVVPSLNRIMITFTIVMIALNGSVHLWQGKGTDMKHQLISMLAILTVLLSGCKEKVPEACTFRAATENPFPFQAGTVTRQCISWMILQCILISMIPAHTA